MTAVGPRATRAERIRSALAALEPERVELVDESHKHVGHEGARDGRGHFALTIVSRRFEGEHLLARHRRVYDALGELMLSDIHALSLRALTPQEDAAR
jgi:BolA family transcriptional regulator, general stress-responsive regulator